MRQSDDFQIFNGAGSQDGLLCDVRMETVVVVVLYRNVVPLFSKNRPVLRSNGTQIRYSVI